MLRKKYRLPIQLFPKQAKIIFRGNHLTIKSAANDLSYNRFGIVIGRAKTKLSSQRNYFRRMIFNFLKVHSPKGGVLKNEGLDFLLVVSGSLKKTDKEAIIKELQSNGLSL